MKREVLIPLIGRMVDIEFKRGLSAVGPSSKGVKIVDVGEVNLIGVGPLDFGLRIFNLETIEKVNYTEKMTIEVGDELNSRGAEPMYSPPVGSPSARPDR